MNETDDLTKKKCEPCEGGVPPMKEDEIKENLAKVDNWKVIDNHHLIKDYKFKDFKSALEFVNKVGEIAENEGHHPNISFTWGKVQIKTYTHDINGLSINDFILAAKIDQIKN